MALEYDFYINGSLGFNTRITKDTPFERATAQFRKEQFDSAPTVGDQSLAGWWTRGQLSFHKGAGIKYYEVLEGETVLNRYTDSASVDVFTPGQATLTKNLSSFGVAATDAVPGPLDGGGGVYALTSAGVKYTNGSGTLSLATSDTNIPTSITSSGQLYYLTNGTKIERQYAAADARVNHVTNPSFEDDLTGWTWDSVSPSGLDVRGDRTGVFGGPFGKYGTHALQINYGTGVNGHAIFTQTTVSGLTVGVTYVASAWVYRASVGSPGQPIVMTIGTASVNSGIVAGVWENVRGTFTATATSHVLKFQVNPSTGTATDNIFVDSVLVTESPFAGDYFDGSQSGCSWQGTPNASKSNYVTASSGASTTRITSTDAAWQKAFWAKGRIWAVDDGNRWYALADAVASVTTASSFWSSTNPNPTWSLADSPGAVYISDGSDIFAVTVGTDGLVPTLGTPVTAARLPLGEQVVGISFYLSDLVVVTTRGVRVAAVRDDKVFLGPLTIKGDFTNCARVGAFDTTAYVAGRLDGRGGDAVLCAVDLSVSNEDLTCPWAPAVTLSADSSTANGCVVDAAGRIYAWAAGDLVGASLDELSPTGYLTTGYHRYGTLEPKDFQSVLVRVGGSGSVAVARVDADGTETALETITAPATSAEVPLGLTAPTERIALKFTLTRSATDSTKGPELLGYQLRALPAPVRQRMLRVPLMLFDRELNRNGQASSGKAWDRLAALEALEATSAVVTFEDKETGETGSGYIEAIEVQRTSPGARSEGFGGLLYLTLRKI